MSVHRKPTDPGTPVMLLENLADADWVTVFADDTKRGHRMQVSTLRAWLLARMVAPAAAGRVMVTTGLGSIVDSGVALEDLGDGGPAIVSADESVSLTATDDGLVAEGVEELAEPTHGLGVDAEGLVGLVPLGGGGGGGPHAATHAIDGDDVLTPAAIGARPVRGPVRTSDTSTTVTTGDLNGTISMTDTGANKTVAIPPSLAVGDEFDVSHVPAGAPTSATVTLAYDGTPGTGAFFIGTYVIPSGSSGLVKKIGELTIGPNTYSAYRVVGVVPTPPQITYGQRGRWTPSVTASLDTVPTADGHSVYTRMGQRGTTGASAALDATKVRARFAFTLLDTEVLSFDVGGLPAGISSAESLHGRADVYLDTGTDVLQLRVSRVDASTLRIATATASVGGSSGVIELDAWWEAEGVA